VSVEDVRVRVATTADLAVLEGIEAAADQLFAPLMDVSGWGAPPTGESRAAEAGFVLIVGEPVVGFAHVLDLDGHLHLEQLAVDPVHGRRGVGSALLEGYAAWPPCRAPAT
jgi:ribosomal protein S18 acetylase RimI-like enzyme